MTEEELRIEKKRIARRTFSLIGLSYIVILLVTLVAQIACTIFLPDVSNTKWGFWLESFLPMYIFGVPSGLLILHFLPTGQLKKQKFKISHLIACIFISIFLMYIGNLIGTGITTIIGQFLGHTVKATIESYASDDSTFFRLLFLVILAPMIEEFLCRKQVIDRIYPYGEANAVVLSALMFGLFHGNFSQFFYAFLLGLVFGYIYLKTGKLRYTIGLHMGINFMGSIVSTKMLEMVDIDAAETMEITVRTIIYSSYAGLILLSVIAGLVLFILSIRKIKFQEGSMQLSIADCLSVTYINVGMILFLLMSLILFVLSVLA